VETLFIPLLWGAGFLVIAALAHLVIRPLIPDGPVKRLLFFRLDRHRER